MVWLNQDKTLLKFQIATTLAFKVFFFFVIFVDKSIEFLRFLYYGEVQGDENLVFKLFDLANKYVQNDLLQDCVKFLKGHINSGNVYSILHFARQENIASLSSFCLDFLKNIDISHFDGVIEHLNKQQNSEFDQENLELRDQAIKRLLENGWLEFPTEQKNNMKFYVDFLIRNLNTDTLLKLSEFAFEKNYKLSEKRGPGSHLMKYIKEELDSLEDEIANLRPALLEFVHQNFKELHEKMIVEKLPQPLLFHLLLFRANMSNNGQRNLAEEQSVSQ